MVNTRLRQLSTSLIPVLALIIILVGYATLAPDAKTLSPWAITFFVVAVCSPPALRWLYRRHSEQYLRRLRFYAERTGWHEEVQTDIITQLPDHLLPSALPLRQLAVVNELVAAKTVGSTPLRLVALDYQIVEDSRGAKSIPQVLTLIGGRLPGRIPGWAHAVPTGSRLMRYWKDQDLESNQFNREVYLAGEPMNLVTKLFSPDLMTWYMDGPTKYWIHAEANMVYIVLDAPAALDELDAAVDFVLGLAEKVGHSGVLNPVRGGNGTMEQSK